MDQIYGILSSLHVDKTFFFQFGIFFIFFLVLKAVFFNKLLFVIEQREKKTVKLEEQANKKFVEAEKLANLYREKLQVVQSETQDLLTRKRSDILNRERSKIKAAEEEIGSDVERKKKEFQVDLGSKKNQILSQADELAQGLVNKLV